MVPERLSRGLTRSADRLVLVEEGEALELRLERGRSVERLAVLALGSELELTGITASSSDLVALLERSRRFRGTSFRSPVTPDKQTGRERFHIAVQVVQGNES